MKQRMLLDSVVGLLQPKAHEGHTRTYFSFHFCSTCMLHMDSDFIFCCSCSIRTIINNLTTINSMFLFLQDITNPLTSEMSHRIMWGARNITCVCKCWSINFSEWTWAWLLAQSVRNHLSHISHIPIEWNNFQQISPILRTFQQD